jgi:hypothetical protein
MHIVLQETVMLLNLKAIFGGVTDDVAKTNASELLVELDAAVLDQIGGGRGQAWAV